MRSLRIDGVIQSIRGDWGCRRVGYNQMDGLSSTLAATHRHLTRHLSSIGPDFWYQTHQKNTQSNAVQMFQETYQA